MKENIEPLKLLPELLSEVATQKTDSGEPPKNIEEMIRRPTGLTGNKFTLREFFKSIGGRSVQVFNSSAVSAYKLSGMVLLSIIVVGMFAYLTISGFYLLNRSWMTPFILNANNEKVIQSNLGYLNQLYQLEKMEADLLAVKSEVRHVDYARELHLNFQKSFVTAMGVEKNRLSVELRASGELLKTYQDFSKNDENSTQNYRQQSVREIEQQYAAQLITQEEMVKAKYQLGQLGTAEIGQKEKLEELQRKTETLKKTLSDLRESTNQLKTGSEVLTGSRSRPTLGVLMKEQPLIQSAIAASELEARSDSLTGRIETLERLIVQYRESVDRITMNPYVRASAGDVTVAFVPYENLGNIKANRKVVGCYLEFLFCKKVGLVTGLLEAEVVGRHPVSGRELRGQLIEIKLDQPSWAKSRSLVANGAPLLF